MRTISFITVSSFIAGSLGIISAKLFGIGSGIDAASLSDDITEVVAPTGWEIIQGFVPTNIVSSMGSGSIIHVLLFGVFLGFAINALSDKDAKPIQGLFSSLMSALVRMIQRVMVIAPIGVFALISDAVASMGTDIIGEMLGMVVAFALIALLFIFVIYPLAVNFLTNYSAKDYFKAFRKPVGFAFASCSSAATLPITMDSVKEMGVKKEVLGFTVPLGCTLNMVGTTALFSLSAVFCANIFGIEIGLLESAAILVTAMLASFGVAGVPGAALLTIPVLMAAGIPLAAVPLLLAVDRLNDMFCTAANVAGDIAIASYGDKD